MPDRFLSYDEDNYTRYLAMFSSMISSIEITQTGSNDALKQGAFHVACLMIHDGYADVDKTMEKTFMQNFESHGRATGAYMNNTKTCCLPEIGKDNTCARTQYLENTFSLADVKPESSSAHKNLSKPKIKINQQCVCRTVLIICSLQFLNPFDAATDKSKLHNISSGAAVSKKER